MNINKLEISKEQRWNPSDRTLVTESRVAVASQWGWGVGDSERPWRKLGVLMIRVGGDYTTACLPNLSLLLKEWANRM